MIKFLKRRDYHSTLLKIILLFFGRAGHILIPTTRDKVAWISLLATRFRQNFVRFEKERVRSINSNANTFQDSNFTAQEEHGSIELVAESLVQRVHFLEVVGRDYSARQQEMLSLLQSSEVLLDPFPIGGGWCLVFFGFLHADHPCTGHDFVASI